MISSVDIPTNCHLYHYAGNKPIVYTDPDGKAKKRGITRWFLNVFFGKEKVEQLFGNQIYDGFFDFSDIMLHSAIEIPATITGNIADKVSIYALMTGNIPLSASAEAISKASDFILLGSKITKAIGSGKKEDWTDALGQALSMGIGGIATLSINEKIATVEVRISKKKRRVLSDRA